MHKEEGNADTEDKDTNSQQDIQDTESLFIHFLTLFLRLPYKALESFLIALPDLNLFRLTKPLVRFTGYLSLHHVSLFHLQVVSL